MRKKICIKCGAIAEKSHICHKRKVFEPRNKKEDKHKILKTYKWQKKRAAIIRRDNYMCQRHWNVDGKIVTNNLEVHHIKNRHDYPSLIFEDSNLICLCSDCNKFYIGKNELDFDWKVKEYEVVL